MTSQLAYAFWDYIICFFDYIPKIIYFLYAALASLLDTLQCLIRRLAGLDPHYVLTGNGFWNGHYEAVNSDPVSDFIMGILGIGENAGAYSALTTTFWSLAIFGLIVLALTTIVAIIKSHYNEDGSKTAPITYLYTAFKSILTFAIVPVVIIAGFWLSSFLLKTLDNITAGGANSETLAGIYGTNYNQVFRPSWGEGEDSSSGGKGYSNYDFFGAGFASSSETFSGLIFKTAARDANRVRRGDYYGGNYYNFDIFGTWIPSGQDTTEWTAYQIDYAFANNLHLQHVTHPAVIYGSTDAFLTITSIDSFGLLTIVSTFSKYNVGLVWCYYNLWQFNFIVGFAAIVTCFWLMMSIILGLMTRIIKSVALFLIYPGVLGLAPLDDWGAFKKWRTEFMQQVLMAFGAIIGTNLFFLILPYLSNIAFFQVDLLNYLVNIVMVITGLVMVKGFITFMSGLIGGADAVAAGDGVKGEVGKTLATGAKMTMGAANVALKAGKFVSPFGAAVSVGAKAARMGIANKMAGKAIGEASKAQAEVDKADDLLYGDAAVGAEENVEKAKSRLTAFRSTFSSSDAGKAALKRAEGLAKSQGLEGDESKKFVENYMDQAMMKDSRFDDTSKDLMKENLKIINQKGYTDAEWQVIQNRDKNAGVVEEATNRAKAIRTSNYMDENGKMVPKWGAQMIGNDARALGGAIAKGFSEGLKDMNLKVGGLTGIFSRATNYKMDDKGKVEGVYGEPKTPYKNATEKAESKQIAKAQLGAFGSSLAGLVFGYGNAGPKDKPKPTGDKLAQQNYDATVQTNKGIEDLGKKIDKLTDAIIKKKP